MYFNNWNIIKISFNLNFPLENLQISKLVLKNNLAYKQDFC